MFTPYHTVHTQFDIVHTLCHSSHSYDTVHTQFDKVHTHIGTVHTHFDKVDTHIGTVHTHFDIVYTLWHSSHNVPML